MISKSLSIGDLVYIPSDVLLRHTSGFTKTEKPTNVVFLGDSSVEYKVFYNGSKCWVNKNKVYDVRS